MIQREISLSIIYIHFLLPTPVAEYWHDAHHFGPFDGLAYKPLAPLGKASDVPWLYFTHASGQVAHEGSIFTFEARIDA